MNDIVMRLKSGREFRFKCEEYSIKRSKLDGTLSEFSYKGGVGECPIYFQTQDIECIAIIKKEQIEELEKVPIEDCIDRYSALAELHPLSCEYKAIKELPSVVPSKAESKCGKWIDDDNINHKYFRCSVCGLGRFNWGEDNYCPNCGAKMEVEE